MIRAYPGRGIPPFLRSWDDYLEQLEAVRAGGGPSDDTMVWWDARPQPRLGTVELRELDVQSDLLAAAALAGLAHAIARRAAEDPPRDPAPGQALHWSSFRAARDGLDAEILHEGRAMPLRDVARQLLTSWMATIRSRASSGSSPRARGPTGSAPRMGAAACRGCCGTWSGRRLAPSEKR